MNNVERDESSPVEIIEGRLKRLHTNEIDARNRLNLNLEGEIDEYLEEKTPVEIIKERKQRLRTSRMDTRLRTPVPKKRTGRAGGKENN